LDNFIGNRWAKSKLLTPYDLWGPYGRTERYKQIIKELDAWATVGIFNKETIETTKQVIAKRLKVNEF
jgi:hypothetical protein